MLEAFVAGHEPELDLTDRAEPFTLEQLERHAREIARGHAQVDTHGYRRSVLSRLEKTADRLEEIYRGSTDAAIPEESPVPAEEWIRDNYYVVKDQIREVRQDLPRSYSHELPKLSDGPWRGYPRVYLLARELVTHAAGRLDNETLTRFVDAYQEVTSLTIGELWAVPIMLRVALLENLRRLGDEVLRARHERAAARKTAEAFSKPAFNSRFLRQLSPAFVVEMLHSLRDQPVSSTAAWRWLQSKLSERGESADELLRVEHQRKAVIQLSIASVIGSMRLLSALDWTAFVERVSLVERVLRDDPADAYRHMDAATRNRYWQSIEQLSKRSGVPEIDVARRALESAREAQRQHVEEDRRHHVGYYLISRGRFRLERDLGYPATLTERLGRFAFRHPALGYLGSINLALGLMVASLLANASNHGASREMLLLVALVTLIPASELALSLVNVLFTTAVPPRPLPKLALRDGIPDALRTMVVVPTIFSSAARVRELVDHLEVRFLANRDDNLSFALLADFPDAAQETLSDDRPLVELASQLVEELNRRYGASRFYLFHRKRCWNPAENCWMGWERKRGKLHEFNRLLRGATNTTFVAQVGDLSRLSSIRYVITLDSDTELPLDAACRLIGTLAHPLNRPRLDPGLRRVTEGYGILQPRIAIGLVSANRTTFAKVFSGHVGIDPYTTAVSDLYQDLFHEGSYVGKGIYEVDTFEAALADRAPDNALLSHDLFEGLFARTALCADIELIDDYPAHYLTCATRLNRWARGDWQILRWLWPTVPDAAGVVRRNVLPAMSRWKIADNLRRSLLPPALLTLLAAGWLVLPGGAGLWTGLALFVLVFPAYVQWRQTLVGRGRGVRLRDHLRVEGENLVTSLKQVLLTMSFLAHQSFVMLDAIIKTLGRLMVTRRRLLEWESAADAAARLRTDLGSVIRRMWIAPLAAAVLFAAILFLAPANLTWAVPVLVLWAASPALAYWTGLARDQKPASLKDDDRALLRRTSRATWRYFEELSRVEDHWLIPDNYQEDRPDPIAHRTSPTNIGLQLLSAVAAHDFGYLTTSDLIEHVERVFATLHELPRYRGHFFNWYDTQTLTPLVPTYISTVDSGNLVGYLLTLRGALAQIVEKTPIIDARFTRGLADTLDLFDQQLEGAGTSDRRSGSRSLRVDLRLLRDELAGAPRRLADWPTWLDDFSHTLGALDLRLQQLSEPESEGGRPAIEARQAEAARWWLKSAADAVARRREEFRTLTPWLMRSSFKDVAEIGSVPSVGDLARGPASEKDHEAGAPNAGPTRGSRAWDPNAAAALGWKAGAAAAQALRERAARLSILAEQLVEDVDFEFLFDPQRRLFAIGYNVTEGRRDSSYYDALASEARLASFVAIAIGKIAQDHWCKLGRTLTPVGHSRALLSWSASMFEYLMPLLVMRTYPNTLLHETYETVIDRQIEYARAARVPWGTSESAYNAQDLAQNYQYRAFGVPGLGLKRGLADDFVIAPYATALAAVIRPVEASENLQRLAHEGLFGAFGFYEAIDYTAERRPPGHSGGVILKTYMAHHQGMTVVALDNCLHDNPMPERFHGDPRVQAAELLLQERIPHLVPVHTLPVEPGAESPVGRAAAPQPVRRYITPHTLSPRAHLLSNGSYSVMVTNAGAGYSRCRDLAMTRWREDITTDCWGSFCYIRDLPRGDFWSTTFHPSDRQPESYEVIFAPDRAVFRRRDSGIEAITEIAVSPEDDAELRRVSLTNHTRASRDIDLTSYAEIVLAPQTADLAHPAFSNLFIETRALPERDALICTRRPRHNEPRLFLAHALAGRGRIGRPIEFETDRARFLGRRRTVRDPHALTSREALSGTAGAVLDPIASLRVRLRLPPGVTARVSLATIFSDNEQALTGLIEKYHDPRSVTRALALAKTHGEIELRHMGISRDEVNLFQRFGSRLIYGDPRLRDAAAAARNAGSQSDLWKHAISGDLPIVLVTIGDGSHLGLVRELIKAQEYLRAKGFRFDLVVVNEDPTSYRQEVQHELQRMAEGSPAHRWINQPGGLFLRRADLLSEADRLLLRATSRAVLMGYRGGLARQLTLSHAPAAEPPRIQIDNTRRDAVRAEAARAAEERQGPRTDRADLRYDNGYGGFTDNGREYLVRSEPLLPWCNVVANRRFGFVASDSSLGYTWAENSHQNRLTAWTNDWVSDPPGEAIYLRDDDTGAFWTATPLPAGQQAEYTVRHGVGYVVYEHEHDALQAEVLGLVPLEDPVKLLRLRVSNTSDVRRRLSAVFYVEWCLGELRARSVDHIVTTVDPATGALFARNSFRQDFGERVAFVDCDRADRTVTGDRATFIGRNGGLDDPLALEHEHLSGRTGAGLDPCGAIQTSFTLEPGQAVEILFRMGEGRSEAEARELVEKYRRPSALAESLENVEEFWDGLLETVQIETPDESLDLLMNRWLLYQTLACRIWARTGFYQSGGAFGFRDQLQDVLALLYAAPAIAREHILRAAARQFPEGDVQHWWHEPGGDGVRTRIQDDRLWLVYATLEYAAATGDTGILDEEIPFLEGRALAPGEHDVYERPTISDMRGTVYEHCARALFRTFEVGPHGLPLIGTGDWNDGMDEVGEGGAGESVWLGWFLARLLPPFADVAAARGEHYRATACRAHAQSLKSALEAAWDGDWYRRAYFDDGTPLGSKSNAECQIDSIAQTWAVISGAADPDRARRAMRSVDELLVRRNERLILLLTPPFDRAQPTPGYIKGYVPGVRENGGQYSHAALWVVMAFAMLGEGDHAYELLGFVNPLLRSLTPEDVQRYRVEPYVVAADIYSTPPHTGRGGWTWHTGSAGWTYRVVLEHILGVRREGATLRVDPCIPKSWTAYEVTIRHHAAEYRIIVTNPSGVNRGVESVELDGRRLPDGRIPLTSEPDSHVVKVVLGRPKESDEIEDRTRVIAQS